MIAIKVQVPLRDVVADALELAHREEVGVEIVEDFIDRCLSIENLIDRFSPYVEPSQSEPKPETGNRGQDGFLLRADRSYMDKFINLPEIVQRQRDEKREADALVKYTGRPERDILQYLIQNAPLESWQQDILSIIRDEAYYFAPQGMTKIMNEGWASYWHSTMMTNNILNDSEVIDYADHHSGTVSMSPTRFNPYKVGLELFRDIEERWNRGQFGKEWNECDLSLIHI